MRGPKAQPGLLDQRVRIESQNNAADGQGGFTKAWATVATVWGAVEPITGSEGVEAGRVEFALRYRVTIRTRLDFDASARLVWTSNGNKALNIREIHDGGPRPQFMMIIAESGVAT